MSSHFVLKIQYVNKPPETRNIGARVTTLGREAGDIVLGDPQSSGRHAEIYFENGLVRVRDLGSTNGTFFNNARTPEFSLQPGQQFSIGQTVMTLMAVHSPQDRPGGGKTMIAMGGMPGRPPGPPRPPGAPPGRPPGAPPGAPPAGFGAPPPGSAPAGFGAPPPSPSGPAPGAPPSQPGGFGAPPPSAPPGQPAGFGAPPPSAPPGQPGGFGAPPPGGPPPSQPGGFGAPPPGQPASFGAAPGGPPPGGMGGPPHGGMGGPPPGSPPPGSPMGGAVAAVGGAMAAGGAMANNAMGQPFGGGPSAPMGAAPGAMAGGEARGDFSGTGGELLGQLLVGYLLTLVTFGIYAPWFICKLSNFIAQRVTVGPTPKGTLRFRFDGQGGDLFVTFLVGYLLTLITFGIYAPWFMCKLTKFYTDNLVATTDSGEEYRARFDGTGGDLFVTFLVGYLLTMITFGIYAPWFICKLNKWYAENTKITKSGQDVGGFDFVGQGGELLVTFIVGYLLTLITFGIYAAWFQVKLLKFNADHTKVNVEGQNIGLRFTGEGGELFVIVLVGYLLTLVTFGIYSFWLMAKLLKWQLSNTVAFSEGGAPMASMGMGGGGGHVAQVGGPPMGQPAIGGAPGYGQPAGQPSYGQPGGQPGYGQPPSY